jgi:PHD/YefM family antitoxin component YafN of YafNO toxin-antitoxin module
MQHMLRKSYQVLTTDEVRTMLDKLHESVTRNLERVVITREGSEARCVLISLAELDAVERALDILSGTAEALAMRDEVMRIAGRAEPQVAVGAMS